MALFLRLINSRAARERATDDILADRDIRRMTPHELADVPLRRRLDEKR